MSVTAMVALAIAFDGFDTALLGLAAPQIAKELGIDLATFAYIFAAGLAGMSVGTIVGGVLGDRWGRRRLVIASVILFSLPTIAIAYAEQAAGFAVLRFVAGLGLGSLIPNGGALVAETTPLKWRNMAVMLAMMCIAVGSVIAGLISGTMSDSIGWRNLFLIGGALPIAYALLLILFLPESPRLLAGKGRDEEKIRQSIRALGGPSTLTIDSRDATSDSRHSIAAVLRSEFGRDCLMLAGAFFFCMLCSYSYKSWLPTVLAETGFDKSDIGFGTAAFHLGSIIGIPIGSLLLMRIGSRRLLPGLCTGAAVLALLLTAAPHMVPSYVPALYAVLIAEAGMIAIVQVALYSVAIHIFPAAIRATGIGLAVGIGRLGSLASAFAASIAIGHGGAPGYFLMIAATMAVVMLFLLMIARHIPGAAKAAA
jgi:AAHS family 4-hydroxybenzoate transporter-like MFS transporter